MRFLKKVDFIGLEWKAATPAGTANVFCTESVCVERKSHCSNFTYMLFMKLILQEKNSFLINNDFKMNSFYLHCMWYPTIDAPYIIRKDGFWIGQL